MINNVLVKTVPMTIEIIEAIIEVDKTFYKDFNYSETSWYFDRYSKENMVTLLFVNGKVVGYYLLLEISDKLFDDILQLKYHGDYDFPVSELNVNSNKYYVPSILVIDEYKKHSFPLLISLKNDIFKKDNIISIAISEEGKRLSSLYMNKIGSPKEGVETYARLK